MDRDLLELKKALKEGRKDDAQRAFSRIYSEYRLLVRSVLSRYLPSSADVEDLSQEVFADFYRKAEGVSTSLKGYLARSSANRAIDLIRKRRGETELAKDEALPEEPLNPPAIAFERWASSVLGNEDWNLVALHLLAGYSFEELAFLKGERAAKLKTRYYRALKKLRTEGKKR